MQRSRTTAGLLEITEDLEVPPEDLREEVRDLRATLHEARDAIEHEARGL